MNINILNKNDFTSNGYLKKIKFIYKKYKKAKQLILKLKILCYNNINEGIYKRRYYT